MTTFLAGILAYALASALCRAIWRYLHRPRFPYDACACGQVLRGVERSDADIDREAERIHAALAVTRQSLNA